jgi:hypothetical protein
MIEEKITNEIEELATYEAICKNALYELQLSKPNQIIDYERKKIASILNRMFEDEKDYLIENPTDYFVINND